MHNISTDGLPDDGTSPRLSHEEASSSDQKPEIYNVPPNNLTSVSLNNRLGSYLSSLWERRHFIRSESKAKAYGSIKGTALGKVWLILDPFLNAAVYYFIFAILLKFDRGMENFVAYLIVGVTFFNFLSKQLRGGAGIIQGGQNLVRAFNFPWASLVFSFSLRTFYDFLPTLLATLAFIVAVPPHAYPTLTWLLFPLVFALSIPFGVGLAFLSSAATELVSDLKFLLPLISRFWFYASGVFWSVEMFADNSVLQNVMTKNPGWVFLELSRETLIYNEVPGLGLWLYFSAWSFGTFLIGFVIFWRNELRFGRVQDR